MRSHQAWCLLTLRRTRWVGGRPGRACFNGDERACVCSRFGMRQDRASRQPGCVSAWGAWAGMAYGQRHWQPRARCAQPVHFNLHTAAAGPLLCPQATMALENQDEGFVAKILMPDGSKDVPVGQAVAILVEEQESVAAFANYSEGGAATASSSSSASSSSAGGASSSAAADAPAAGGGSFPAYLVGEVAAWQWCGWHGVTIAYG